MSPGTQTSSSQKHGGVGKVIASLFFGIFLALGCTFTGMIGKSVWQVAATYRWQRADCEIITSAARVQQNPGHSNKPYEYLVEYRYESDGQPHISTRWSSKDAAFERYEDAQRLADRYRPGTRALPRAWQN